MSRTLVLRLSALGDVAMLIPILYSAAKKYQQDEFLLVTKSPLLPIFEHRPENVKIFPVDSKHKYKGFFGLKKLVTDLSKEDIDKVADIHDVLRTKIIRFFQYLKGRKIAVIDKGRWEKRALVRKHNKIFKQLPNSTDRYLDVFNRLGYEFPVVFKSVFEYGDRDFSLISSLTGEKTGKWIGIAPFAKHKGKIYPPEKTREVIDRLATLPDTKIFLFGGKEEQSQLELFIKNHTNVISVVGKFSFSTELLLMSYLDVMLAMDSGNMHLASLVSTPVVSIWGATHPYAGFYAYGQNPGNIIQADLFCRPCSVFGNKPCYRKNYECMSLVTPQRIVDKLLQVLPNSSTAY